MEFSFAQMSLSILIYVVHYSWADDVQSCHSGSLHPCGADDQICDDSTGHCICAAGFVLSASGCVRAEPTGGAGHAGVAAAVGVAVTALLLIGAVLIVRRYKLVEYARRKLEARRNRDVMYEDVMIGQDDPPLTP